MVTHSECNEKCTQESIIILGCTAWKVSKYRVLSGPYFPVLGLNTES